MCHSGGCSGLGGALLGRQRCQAALGCMKPRHREHCCPKPKGFSWASTSPAATQESKIHESTSQATAVTGYSSVTPPFSPWSSSKRCILYRGHENSVFTLRCSYVTYPTPKGTAPVWGAWLCCWEDNPWVAQKPPFSPQLRIPCKHFYSLCLIKARTSPSKPEL